MSKYNFFIFLSLILLVTAFAGQVYGQRKTPANNQGQVNDAVAQPTQQYDRQGRPLPPNPNTPGSDSLKHRTNLEDSITISFRYFDSTRTHTFDSSLNDFTVRYPVPAQYITLGNFGAAARPIIFTPFLQPGFDPGHYAFDIYRLKVQDTRFFRTTRPFTELGYMLGSKAEQMINIIHTQNIRPDFNFALQYRLINSPGNLQNQNASHNSYRANANYQSRNKRYTAYAILLSNKLNSSETGGIQSLALLNDARYTNRFVIPTRLAGDSNASRNPFNTSVVTGNVYGENIFLYRHQYDFGQSDSLVVNDSTVIRLFYPRFRLQHTLTSQSRSYEFRDLFSGAYKTQDYRKYFGLGTNDTVVSYSFKNTWRNITNEFSLISFPEKNNLNQFIKAGAALENIKGTFENVGLMENYNVILNGEYRNRTRNQKWDLEAAGAFYLNGLNSGDYSVNATLKRMISKKLGYLEAGFQNVNRSPSYIYTGQTSFPMVTSGSLNKENITRIRGSLVNDAFGFRLWGEYYLVSNYTYFNNFFSATQEGTLFNVLHLAGSQKFKLSKGLHLYAEVHLQQTTPNAPVQLPLIYTNNRVAYEGVYAKNMVFATGLEVRYNTPYKADNYSPFFGEFFYQNDVRINNRPEINAFFNFRIKRFTAYVRAENLNTISRNTGSIGFNKNNLSAPYYPQQGLWIRIGIFWTFIN